MLILGSMPGAASLRAGQYYAHPQNLFWRLLGEFAGFDPHAAYLERIWHLEKVGIAVWDVLAHCERKGSLDAAIKKPSPNNFAHFFAQHTLIEHVYFNGSAAARLYQRHVAAELRNTDLHERLVYHTLPSTSPANAALSFAHKRQRWLTALAQAQIDCA